MRRKASTKTVASDIFENTRLSSPEVDADNVYHNSEPSVREIVHIWTQYSQHTHTLLRGCSPWHISLPLSMVVI